MALLGLSLLFGKEVWEITGSELRLASLRDTPSFKLMPPELRSLTAQFLHGRTLVRGPKSYADRYQRPSPCGCWGRGDSAHTSLLNFPSHFGLAAAFKDMRPIQEFHVNIAPFTGTTNLFLWDPALPPGRHQKQLFASKLPDSSESHPLPHLFLPVEEENKGQGCRKYCWHRPLQSCQALGGFFTPSCWFCLSCASRAPQLLPASILLPEPAGEAGMAFPNRIT